MPQDGQVRVRNPALIDALLADKGMSKAELAGLLGVNRATVSQILNGRITCDPRRAEAIESHLQPAPLFIAMPSAASSDDMTGASTSTPLDTPRAVT